MKHFESDTHRKNFAEIVNYLKTCVSRPLTDAEILSAWDNAKTRTLDAMLTWADIERKRAREEA